MATETQKSNAGTGHYDTNLEDNIPMYDKQPYYRDASFCIYDPMKIISGNVIKFYRCHYIDTYDINATDK